MKFWAVIQAFYWRLAERPDPAARRLKRLRRIYQTDAAAGLHTRLVRENLRGVVAPAYQPHYDRLLRMERVTVILLAQDVPPGIASADLLAHVFKLTERAIRLLDQLQRSDEVLALYSAESPERERIEESRRRLLERINETLALQESIPARLLQLTAASIGNHDEERLKELLLDLNARLEGMTESYEALHTDYIKRSEHEST